MPQCNGRRCADGSRRPGDTVGCWAERPAPRDCAGRDNIRGGRRPSGPAGGRSKEGAHDGIDLRARGGARVPPARGGPVDLYRLPGWGSKGWATSQPPDTLKILLENLLRRAGSRDVSDGDVAALAAWPAPAARDRVHAGPRADAGLHGRPRGRRPGGDAERRRARGGDPAGVNPHVPVDLIIDHSVQVDLFRIARRVQAQHRVGVPSATRERYALLRWAQQAFDGLRVVPPGMGICHQVNLEHLGQVVSTRDGVAIPDTLVGTDSHTTMVNGLGVLGWGVGGIEAEAAMLGQPMYLPQPIVVGVRVTARCRPGRRPPTSC